VVQCLVGGGGQAQLLAATISYVGQAFLEKTGAIAGEANTVQ
jgi:hypothetical protein